MLGQAERLGVLNPETGHAAEAVLPVYKSPLDQFGASQNFEGPLVIPWAFTRVARGVRANDIRREEDALMNVSNKPSEINIYQMPTILVSYQLPGTKSMVPQNNRLPLNMVAPKLAWSPS